MKMKFISYLSTALFMCNQILSQEDIGLPTNPCPDVFQYERTVEGRWQGTIKIIPPVRFSEVVVEVKMTLASRSGGIHVRGGIAERKRIAVKAREGQKQVIIFDVVFINGPIPQLYQVIINGHEFCRHELSLDKSFGSFLARRRLVTGLRIPVANGTEFSIFGSSNDTQLGLLTPECGKRNVAPTRVVGGNDANWEEFPWHVGLFGAKNGTFVQFCGGTLIKSNIVITAAHCIYNEIWADLRNKQHMKVVLGGLFREWDKNKNDKRVQNFDVAELSVPRGYVGGSKQYINDIGIVKLQTNAVLSNTANVACYDWDNNYQLPMSDSKGTVAGWGLNSDNEYTNTLQWVDLPLVNTSTCLRSVKWDRAVLTDDSFCAGYIDKNTSVCQGDSGGGFMMLDVHTETYYLRGVVSKSLGYNPDPTKCVADVFTSLTSFSYHRKWLRERVTELLRND